MTLPSPPVGALPAGEIRRSVEASQQGDRRAFARLHRRYQRTVRGILIARQGVADLEDLEQEVFALALEHLQGLRDPGAFVPWLAQIARRVAARHRSRPRYEPLTDEFSTRDAPRMEAMRVLDHIRALPACYSEPLVLRLVLGMSGEEIARDLGYAPGSVRVNLHRGMKKLRALVAPTTLPNPGEPR